MYLFLEVLARGVRKGDRFSLVGVSRWGEGGGCSRFLVDDGGGGGISSSSNSYGGGGG
jgi:hypothetical protein